MVIADISGPWYAMKLKPHQLLWVGLWGSIGWILMGLTTPTQRIAEHESTAVAWVDGVAIERDRYFRILASVAAQNGPPINRAIRRTVLNDLIAEELLLSRALSLGLPRNAALARRHLLSAMTQLAQGEPVETADEATLRAYFDAHRQHFRKRTTVAVQRMIFRDDTQDGAQKARNAHRRLAGGETFESVKMELADEAITPLPKGLMPTSTLRHYIGPTAAQAATNLRLGEVSDVIASAGGFQLIKVLAHAEEPAPEFDDVADSVRALFERDAKARELQQYVEILTEQAEIHINEPVVDQSPIPDEALRHAKTPAWDAGPRNAP